MRFSARALFFVLFLSIVLSTVFPSFALAQSKTTQPVPTVTLYPATNQYVNPYNVPNTDANVPANQHTRVQTLVIDMLSATMCLLVGIDPADKGKPCLDVNPQTGKIGYSPAAYDENGQPKVGGVLGASTTMISMLYTPSISTSQYGDYLAQNFGIVKPAYAQDAGYGFNGLDSLLVLWTSIRNMAYFLLMLAFVIIGLGVMLRVKIDPRTVMTLQNQIPRIVICILLVTFSYPIAGLLVDTMWLTTYVGINIITDSGGQGTASAGTNTAASITDPIVPGNDSLRENDPNRADRPLSESASANLLQMPITYVNQVFRSPDTPASGNTNIDSGIGHITDEVSYSMGVFVEEMIRQIMGTDENQSCFSLVGGFDLGACLAGILGWVANILLWLIILITIFKTLFSVWFTLLKAYTYIIIYTIAAPFFIVMGLLPGKPLGFEKWLRSMVANLAVFPVTAFVFVLARLFVELFKNTGATAAGAGATGIAAAGDADRFVPPLVANPNIIGIMGWIIAFGLILMTPPLLTMLQEALKVPGNKHGGAAIGGALAAGAMAPKALTGAMWNRATRKAKLHEYDAGFMRRWAAGTQLPNTTDNIGWNPRTWNRANIVNLTRKARSRLYTHNDEGRRRS